MQGRRGDLIYIETVMLGRRGDLIYIEVILEEVILFILFRQWCWVEEVILFILL